MRTVSARALAVVLLTVLATGVSCRRPFSRSADERKAECDRMAAAAIQTSSLEEAKNLSAQASGCYANLQTR